MPRKAADGPACGIENALSVPSRLIGILRIGALAENSVSKG